MKLDIIYNEDCIEGMRSIPNESIDLIVTDPPYGIKYKSNFRQVTNKFNMLLNDDNDVRLIAYDQMFRILKNNSCCIVFCSWKNYNLDYDKLSQLFDIKNVLIWYKRGGGIGDLKHTLSTNYEIAIVCHKGKCPIRGKRDGSVIEINKVNPNKMVHPTEKPVDLMKYLIEKFSDERSIIMDPFIGSGTTAIACLETGRHYIGYELDPEYYKIAQNRILDYELGYTE